MTGDMDASEPTRFARARRLAWLPAVLAAILVYSPALVPGFGNARPAWVPSDLAILEADDPLLERPWHPREAGYSPVADFTRAILSWTAHPAWGARVLDVALHASVALLAFLLLREIFADPLLAAVGATLFAVQATHTEAVAGSLGRRGLLAAAAFLTAWLLSLRLQGRGGDARRDARLAFFASAAIFAGQFSWPGFIILVPFLFLQAWLLRRRVPWILVAAALSSGLGFVLVRNAARASSDIVHSYVSNYLVASGAIHRALTSARLVTRYLVQTVAPVRLSADHSIDELPFLGIGHDILWLRAAAIAVALLLLFLALRKRLPVISLAIGLFVLGLLPALHLLGPGSFLFAERYLYLPALAFPIALCGFLALPAIRRRPAIVACIGGALILAHGLRAWSRVSDWDVPLLLRMTREASRSVWAWNQEGEAYLHLSIAATDPAEKARLGSQCERRAARILELFPACAQGHLLLARLRLSQVADLATGPRPAAEAASGELARAVREGWEDVLALLDRALVLYTHQLPALPELNLYRWRGETLVELGRTEPDAAKAKGLFAQAEEDLDFHVSCQQRLGGTPDAGVFHARGRARARLDRLREALRDFNTAISLRRDVPECWNDRGYCRFLLGDRAGAVRDYERGVVAARRKGILYDPSRASVWTFFEKIADVHRHTVLDARAAGDAEAARRAEALFVQAKTAAAGVEAKARAGAPK